MRFPRLASIAHIALFASLLLIRASSAQQPTTEEAPLADLPIEGLLLRLQLHLWDYTANVPSFFCDEHVVSDMNTNQMQLRGGPPAISTLTTTDSIFRLKRSDPNVQPVQLTEAREIKAVNNKPAKGESIAGPAIFSGAFSSGLNVVSLELMRCYNYHLVYGQRLHHNPVLVIDYALKPSISTDHDCPGPEMQTGRAYIDPQNFQLLRIEMRTPNHRIESGILTLWTWSVDYAPVAFENKLFWMPKTIASAVLSNNAATRWSFTATYRNYHKLTVTSRILPAGDN